MAKIEYHRTEDDMVTVCGVARTLTVAYDGSKYQITQFAHIDDTGRRKVRQWGEFEKISDAITRAKLIADRLL